jgi:hypothetical protein
MKIYWSLILFLICLTIKSQTIPLSRTVDWKNTGYPGPIPEPTNIIDVTTFGGIGDSLTDNTAAINSAMNSLNGIRGVIYFPPGNFIVNSSIDIPDSVILRGASADSTHIIFNLNNVTGNGFNITGSVSAAATLFINSSQRGDASINVVDASAFIAGDYAEILEDNGSWDTQPQPWSGNSVGQIVRITNISGNTIYFESPLRINFDTALAARIQKIIPAAEIGIECMSIARADGSSPGVCYNIFYNYAANCWIRGIESKNSVGSHIEADASTNLSIRGCYIHHSYLYDGVSTHGYGITLFAHTGQCRIENNIMVHLRHSFSLQTGANGNVIAYNYSTDPFRSEIPNDAGVDISLHGHFPFANLIEGNIVQNIQIDYTHGPSGPFNTFFRNRAEGYGILMSTGSYPSDSMNFAGNEITNPAFLHGNYTLAGSAHFEYGNNVRGTITPPGTNNLPDSSYYLDGLPSFLTSPVFPTIGIPNTISAGSIPARDRFLSGNNLTDCDDEITIGIAEIENSGMKIFPNPASNQIIIEAISKMSAFSINLKDLNGKIILQRSHDGNSENYCLDLPKEIANGVYLLEIFIQNKKIVKRIEVLK